MNKSVVVIAVIVIGSVLGFEYFVRSAYQRHKEAIITSTYAYSLHLQGRTREGLAALEKLKTESIELPPVALYYGVLLAAIGETNKARKYLELAQRANSLPEEKALLAATLK